MSTWLRRRTVADRVVAVLMGLVLAPVIAVLAAVVRRDTPGPGILALPRVGQHGRLFRIWKIRTMHATGPGGQALGETITSGNDARVTQAGRRLRALRLDELPQIWNVVRGEMAILGPRPEAPGYVDQSASSWLRVLRARPGIAGPTQLLVADLEAELGSDGGYSYQDDVLPIKLAIDAWYVEHASPGIDVLVLASLAGRLLFGRKPRRLFEEVSTAVAEARALDGRY